MHSSVRFILWSIIAMFLLLLLTPVFAQTAACQASRVQPTWTDSTGKHECGAKQSLVALNHNQYWHYRQTSGLMRGTLTQRCLNGVRMVRGATCWPATHCDALWTFTVRGDVYRYNGWGSGKIAPGTVVPARASNGKEIPVICGDDFRMRPVVGKR